MVLKGDEIITGKNPLVIIVYLYNIKENRNVYIYIKKIYDCDLTCLNKRMRIIIEWNMRMTINI